MRLRALAEDCRHLVVGSEHSIGADILNPRVWKMLFATNRVNLTKVPCAINPMQSVSSEQTVGEGES